MAKIQEAKVIKELIDKLKLSPGFEKIPSELADKIIPIISADPQIILEEIHHKAANGTIITTPTDKDFYFTDAMISCLDGTGTGGVLLDSITLTPFGKAAVIILVAQCFSDLGTTTETNAHQVLNLKNPIKLARGSNIVFTKGSAAGKCSIFGYTKEPQ